MMNLPDELLDNYSKDMLKKRETVDGLVNRVVESKLTAALKKDVKLKKKKVSVEEFNKLFENPSVS
jgi:trigger factor